MLVLQLLGLLLDECLNFIILATASGSKGFFSCIKVLLFGVKQRFMLCQLAVTGCCFLLGNNQLFLLPCKIASMVIVPCVQLIGLVPQLLVHEVGGFALQPDLAPLSAGPLLDILQPSGHGFQEGKIPGTVSSVILHGGVCEVLSLVDWRGLA